MGKMIVSICILIMIIGALLFEIGTTREEYSKKDNYLSYCSTKMGFSYDACKWEYERVKNGGKPMILPLVDKFTINNKGRKGK